MIIIEHQATADMDDGQALPPFWDGSAWHVVRRLPNQQTLWRRIGLQTTQSSTAAAQLCGNSSSGRHQTRNKWP